MTFAEKLRTEYFKNPLGIDVDKPRFSWKMNDHRRGAAQRAYRIEVRTDSATVWDSGKVISDCSIHIEYDGEPLQARTRYFWDVSLWDEQDAAGTQSETAWFETGLMDESGFAEASWIGSGLIPQGADLTAVPIVRSGFRLRGPVLRARLYVTALGVYQMYCNGKKVGDAQFTPGWTRYSSRVQYQTWDMTPLLREGENVIAALLGTGWYCGRISWALSVPPNDGKFPLLRSVLAIDYADGTGERFCTDDTWKWTRSPILYSDIYEGERYDACQEIPGWSDCTGDDTTWSSVVTANPACGSIVSQRGPLVKKSEELQPVNSKEVSPGVHIVNIGQNMVGWIRLRLEAPRGTTVRVRFAERLNADGTLYTANYRSAKSEIIYTCAGGGVETWEPHFTFFGFQYLEISDYPHALNKDTVTGLVLHSEMERTADFTCSDNLVNQLYRNIVWGQRGNYLDVPTDCPQRDERLGWTGDAQVFMRTATFNFDVGGFFTKWLHDLNDSQVSTGEYPIVAPYVLSDSFATRASSAWSDAGIICPWVLYRVHGDRRILQTHYENMKRWISFQEPAATGEVRNLAFWGDWLNINDDTPGEVISTAFLAHTAFLMSRIAAVLNREEDRLHYCRVHERAKKSFNDEFVTANGRIIPGSQTAYLLALQFDLLPESLRARAVEYLVQNIRKRNTKISAGFVGSPYMNLVLSRFGRSDVAYELLHQTQWPSWLYAVTKGATTIWERWEGWTEEKGFQSADMNSFNHYAYGAIGEWLFRRVAGIDLDESLPGYKRFIIAPVVGGNLSQCSAWFESPYGRVSVAWETVTHSELVVKVLIPPNTTAHVSLPAHSVGHVTENGMSLNTVTGLQDVRAEDGAVTFDAAAGAYRFRCQRNP